MIVGRIGRDVDPERRFNCRARHPRARAHALQHGELAYRPHRRQQTLECRTAAPRRAGGAAEFLPSGELLRRGRVVLTQLGYQARSQLGRVAVDVVPPGSGKRERAGEDQRPRSLRSCCREDDGGRAALADTENDGLSEADGVHDGLDLGRSIIQRANLRDRVRQPDPGLVEHKDATERGELLHEGLVFGQGPGQLDVAGERPGDDELDGPVAEHLKGQAEIAAGCVRRFRHGSDHTDPGHCEYRLWRSCAPPAPMALRPRRAAHDTPRRPAARTPLRHNGRSNSCARHDMSTADAPTSTWPGASRWPRGHCVGVAPRRLRCAKTRRRPRHRERPVHTGSGPHPPR